MEKITELLDNLDLAKFVPKLDTLMGWVQWLTSLAVRLGPLCILVLGLIYLLIPPKEANRKAGYRTYFGMGSIAAWRMTQLVSGVLMTVIGLILTVSAYATAKKFEGLDPMAMADAAFRCIKTQVICVLAIFIFMFVFTALMFTRKGDLRFKVLHGTLIEKILFDDKPMKTLMRVFGIGRQRTRKPMFPVPAPEAAAEEEPAAEYERQGEQVITADDIVIEDL